MRRRWEFCRTPEKYGRVKKGSLARRGLASDTLQPWLLLMALHEAAQHSIHAALPASPLPAEVVQHVGVKAHRHLALVLPRAAERAGRDGGLAYPMRRDTEKDKTKRMKEERRVKPGPLSKH